MLTLAWGTGCEAGFAGLWRLAPRGAAAESAADAALKQAGDTDEGRDRRQVRSAARLCQMLKAGQKPHAAPLNDTELASTGGCDGAERSERHCRSLGAEGERLSRQGPGVPGPWWSSARLPAREARPTRARSAGGEDAPEDRAAQPSILAWRIPCAEEPGGCSPWGRTVRTEGTDRSWRRTPRRFSRPRRCGVYAGWPSGAVRPEAVVGGATPILERGRGLRG